jgi:hypothetical protein
MRTTKAGKTIEIEKYYTSRYKKKGITKGDKVKPTSEQQKKVNTKHAERKLRLILNENFTGEDIHLVLPYTRARGEPPVTKEQMRKDINEFLRPLRKEFKMLGQELKYIHVMETGKKGARHHHLVINYIDIHILQKIWTKARVQIFPMDKNGQYGKLASYLIKFTDKTVGTDEALQGRRWNSSTNLRRPEPEIEIISEHEWYRTEPKPLKGYYIEKESVEIGIHNPEYSGYGFFRYRMIQLE